MGYGLAGAVIGAILIRTFVLTALRIWANPAGEEGINANMPSARFQQPPVVPVTKRT